MLAAHPSFDLWCFLKKQKHAWGFVDLREVGQREVGREGGRKEGREGGRRGGGRRRMRKDGEGEG